MSTEEGTIQEKAENEVEGREGNATSISLGESKSEPRSTQTSQAPNPDENFLATWNLGIRSALKKVVVGNKLLWFVVTNAFFISILIASIVHYFKTEPPDIEWCNGVGFLWILYCFVYTLLFYRVLNTFIGHYIHRCLKPLFRFFAALRDNRTFRYFVYWIPIGVLAGYVIFCPGKSGRRIFSFVGLAVFVSLGYLFSVYPAHVKWRPVLSGMFLQFFFGILTIQLNVGKIALDCLGTKVTRFLQYSEEGSLFVFGYLSEKTEENEPVFAFSVLPIIYFFSFFINILSYYGLLQWFILYVSKIMRICMGTTVCESVHATASIFLGSVEAPLLIQKYLKDMTKSEICAILCAGWSTVAGVLMAAYIQFGVKASHLIVASIMSAPASLSYSKLIYPETEESVTRVDNIVLHKEKAVNFLDAASSGAVNAIMLIGSIIANIVAFLAFIAFLDGIIIWLGELIGFEQLSFQFLASKIFYPISFLMGVDLDSLEDVAYLLGIKTVVNEFQAYKKLGELIKANKISERSEIIATYALCGFSNFGSIGIVVGAVSVIEPRQASTAAEVAIPAFIAANIVCFLTACVAEEVELTEQWERLHNH